jgi:hypothetical protein
MAGHSKAEIVSAIKAAFDNKQLPDLENGAMAFMMSKSAYLTAERDHNGPHLMFFTALNDGKNWGGPLRSSSRAGRSPRIAHAPSQSPFGHHRPRLILQRWRHALDEFDQALAPRFNVSAVLNVVG